MGMLLRRYHKKSAEQAKEDSANEAIKVDQVDQEESTEDNQVDEEVIEDDQVGQEDLADKNVTELKELAKEAGVANYSKLKKAELIKELNSL